MILKYLIFAYVLLSINLSYASNDPDYQKSQALKSVKIINEIVNKITASKPAEFYDKELTDSICFSHMSTEELFMENNDRDRLKYNLGNNLNFERHLLSMFSVSYVIYNYKLLKINIDFDFEYFYIDERMEKLKFFYPDSSFVDSLTSQSPIRLYFKRNGENHQISGFFCSYILQNTLEKLMNKNNSSIFNISVRDSDSLFKTDAERINDPANHLEYGFACGIGGDSPEGYSVFAGLVHYKKYYIIENLIFSFNPVTRLMAVDAIEYLKSNNLYFPTVKTLTAIKKIKKENTIIEACWGCEFENISIKDAYKKAEENKNHLYDSFIFINDK
jgi:hypothetical protein